MNEITKNTNTPFSTGWYSFDLGEYRPCHGTYCLYEYETLPPLIESPHIASFGWLEPLTEDLEQTMQSYQPSSEEPVHLRENLQKIMDSARQLGLTLPDSFLHFMASPDLQNRIPSCTACYFELSEKIVPCPGSQGGYVLRFLNDQQGVLTWYLYLTAQHEPSVVVSPFWLDELSETSDEHRVAEAIFLCSFSFEAFLYRFWLENTIWFKLNGQQPLTEEERHYLSHYTFDERKPETDHH